MKLINLNILIIVGIFSLNAHATLIGHTLQADWLEKSFDTIIESHQFIVGNGAELTADDIVRSSNFSIDVGSNYILFDFPRSTSWSASGVVNGWMFTDINDDIPDFLDVDLTIITGSQRWFGDNDIIFDENSITLNFWAVSILENNTLLRFDIKTAEVPAPSTISLVFIGIIIFQMRTKGVSLYKKRVKNDA